MQYFSQSIFDRDNFSVEKMHNSLIETRTVCMILYLLNCHLEIKTCKIIVSGFDKNNIGFS